MRTPERVRIQDTTGTGVTLTATVRDNADFVVDVTQHAVESGANIIDHARPKLATLQLEGLVSDLNDGDGAAQTALLFFMGLWTSPRVVEISSPRIAYDAMLMTKLAVPRRKEDGRAARFILDFTEYKVVNVRRTVVQVVLAKPAKKGPQQGKIVLPAPNLGGGLKHLSDAGGGGITGILTGIGRGIGSMVGGPK